eukprot:NODE_9937_length_1389_cov_7.513471.p1 GENE.NODE_9937_length_1389_cov_7.513471~~NODE_9937_length_1389_cov_7.513471.p1  ORF type:complete len:171 (-),score=39.23 NODE_9937_length_1389_cov_7.513471:41-553(-)
MRKAAVEPQCSLTWQSLLTMCHTSSEVAEKFQQLATNHRAVVVVDAPPLPTKVVESTGYRALFAAKPPLPGSDAADLQRPLVGHATELAGAGHSQASSSAAEVPQLPRQCVTFVVRDLRSPRGDVEESPPQQQHVIDPFAEHGCVPSRIAIAGELQVRHAALGPPVGFSQ